MGGDLEPGHDVALGDDLADGIFLCVSGIGTGAGVGSGVGPGVANGLNG